MVRHAGVLWKWPSRSQKKRKEKKRCTFCLVVAVVRCIYMYKLMALWCFGASLYQRTTFKDPCSITKKNRPITLYDQYGLSSSWSWSCGPSRPPRLAAIFKNVQHFCFCFYLHRYALFLFIIYLYFLRSIFFRCCNSCCCCCFVDCIYKCDSRLC